MINWNVDSMKNSVESVKSWRYKFGPPYSREHKVSRDEFSRHLEWAVITIDEKGMFAATSDYGEYVFHWSGWGSKDIRLFLAGCCHDPHYFMRKLAKEDYLNVKSTVKWVKEHILSNRREGHYNSKEARQEYNLISDCTNEEEIREWEQETELDDAWEMIDYTIDPMAQNFAQYILPRLRVVLLDQIKQESKDPLENYMSLMAS